jgi:predicted N-acetyltransferase YhbS
MVSIRTTSEADEPAIRALHEAAFGTSEGSEIADLAIALLHDPTASPYLSLLAHESTPAGHVIFTSARIEGCAEAVRASILAPLAVHPDMQKRGVGGALVNDGLTRLERSGCDLVFVLGHPEYYPRFGFAPAKRHGLLAPHPIPEEHDDAWMVLELRSGTIARVRGTVRCADVLEAPRHWRE